jgi:uncharacterized protein YndB with AHSA1/START domain
MRTQANAERKSDREIVSSRLIRGPSHLVFEAWAESELFQKWWVPKSAPIRLEFCEMEVRTGGTYRLVFSAGDQTAEFFGKYLEVTPHSRLVWTNEEGEEGSTVITTVTLEDVNGGTWVVVSDLYPSKEALDDALAVGSVGAMPEQLEQLAQLLNGPPSL